MICLVMDRGRWSAMKLRGVSILPVSQALVHYAAIHHSSAGTTQGTRGWRKVIAAQLGAGRPGMREADRIHPVRCERAIGWALKINGSVYVATESSRR